MSKPETVSELYDYMDSMSATSHLVPSAAQLQRRKLGRVLQKLSAQVARSDASEDQMSAYIQELELVSSQLEGHAKIDSNQLFERLYRGIASSDDLLLDADSGCLIGAASPVGFPMELEAKDGKIIGNATIPIAFQGPPLRVHGGIVAAVFDILLSRTQLLCNFLGFTADLRISYQGAVPLDTCLRLEAEVVSVDDRKLINTGTISADGKVCARAEGLWIKPKSGLV